LSQLSPRLEKGCIPALTSCHKATVNTLWSWRKSDKNLQDMHATRQDKIREKKGNRNRHTDDQNIGVIRHRL
jgi:hypothetical protein